MKFTAAALFSAFVSAVVAQAAQNAGVAINTPSLGQVATAGTTLKITWTVATANASANINSIALMSGASTALSTAIPNILSGAIPVNPPSYDWAIPANVATLPSYVLALAGDNGFITYSPYFTIMAAAPGTAAASSAAPAASGATASASAGASASNSTASPSASATKTSGANSLKAGIVGAAGVAGAVALLL